MKYDVAVIGGSTSGLYAAELLASAGLSVGVFERRENLDAARRTLIVTPALQRVVGTLPDEATVHRVRFMDLEAGGEQSRIEFQDPDLVVERSYLIRYWADRARRAGAEFHFGMRFNSFRADGPGTTMRFGNNGSDQGTAYARIVLGADGANSKVALSSGLRLPPRVPLVQAEVALPSGWDPAATRVWFDDTTRFFYWLIPESEERGVLGLAGEFGAPIRPVLDEFLGRLGLEALNYQSAQVALYRPGLKQHVLAGTTSVFLVGDAAGHVKISTIGGTVTGLWGAKAVAEHILTGAPLRRGLRDLNRELMAHWYARLVLERIGDHGYQQLIRALNPSVRALLAKNDRDSLSSWVWKLPLYQPRLLALPFRALLKPSRIGRGAAADSRSRGRSSFWSS